MRSIAFLFILLLPLGSVLGQAAIEPGELAGRIETACREEGVELAEVGTGGTPPTDGGVRAVIVLPAGEAPVVLDLRSESTGPAVAAAAGPAVGRPIRLAGDGLPADLEARLVDHPEGAALPIDAATGVSWSTIAAVLAIAQGEHGVTAFEFGAAGFGDVPDWTETFAEDLAGLEPDPAGEVLVAIDRRATWYEVQSILIGLARRRLGRISFVVAGDRGALVKLPGHLPTDSGLRPGGLFEEEEPLEMPGPEKDR